MKCIRWRGTGQVERVSDERAFDMVERKAVANYVPRRTWKLEVRDAPPEAA